MKRGLEEQKKARSEGKELTGMAKCYNNIIIIVYSLRVF